MFWDSTSKVGGGDLVTTFPTKKTNNYIHDDSLKGHFRIADTSTTTTQLENRLIFFGNKVDA